MIRLIWTKLSDCFLRLGGTVKYAKKKGVNIGKNVTIMSNPNYSSEPYLITIGDNTRLSVGITFLTHDGGTWVFRNCDKYRHIVKFGKINVKENCFIGANVTIMPGVTIGPNSVVAAGSVVTKDVPPNSVWGGVPAKHLKTLDEYIEKCVEECPEYDIENFKKNKKEEVLKMMEGK